MPCWIYLAFAHLTLSQALRRLHQLRILGHTLVVEFAKDQDHAVVLKSPKVSDRYAGRPGRASEVEVRLDVCPVHRFISL